MTPNKTFANTLARWSVLSRYMRNLSFEAETSRSRAFVSIYQLWTVHFWTLRPKAFIFPPLSFKSPEPHGPYLYLGYAQDYRVRSFFIPTRSSLTKSRSGMSIHKFSQA